jgi:NAD(P)-dependent dehydrogenase (short-subunit alcohol dehydrogenase family)
MTELSGRTTIVVGASRGLGRGIATAFAKACAPVVAVARTAGTFAEPGDGALAQVASTGAGGAGLGDPRNRKLARGLVTKPDVFSRNVPNPLHAAEHAGAIRTRGTATSRSARCGMIRRPLLRS